MANTVNLLSDLMSSPDWPAEWLTVEEIAAEMERRGLWDQRPFRSHTHARRLDYLADVLRGHSVESHRVWVQMGSRFKHSALITDADRALREDWLERRRAAFDEDLSRILLGETPHWQYKTRTPNRRVRELLRQARPLVDELSSYVQQDAYVEHVRGSTGERVSVARRMEELALALSNLFDRSTEQPV